MVDWSGEQSTQDWTAARSTRRIEPGPNWVGSWETRREFSTGPHSQPRFTNTQTAPYNKKYQLLQLQQQQLLLSNYYTGPHSQPRYTNTQTAPYKTSGQSQTTDISCRNAKLQILLTITELPLRQLSSEFLLLLLKGKKIKVVSIKRQKGKGSQSQTTDISCSR